MESDAFLCLAGTHAELSYEKRKYVKLKKERNAMEDPFSERPRIDLPLQDTPISPIHDLLGSMNLWRGRLIMYILQFKRSVYDGHFLSVGS